MSLKGLNRNQFESAMMKILRYRLKTVGKFKVYCTQSTFYMEPEEEDVDMDLAFDRVSKVFGLAALSRAVVCDKDFDTICQTAEDYLGASLHGIRTFISDIGFKEIRSFPNGKEAWDYISQFSGYNGDVTNCVAAVITDIEMPQMDGHHLTKLIKSDPTLKKIPVFLFSSLINEQMYQKGLSVGADEQFSKPQIGMLIERLIQILS